MTEPFEGGRLLGDIVFGGPQQRAQDEYVAQYKKNADAAGAMYDARKKRFQSLVEEGRVKSRGIITPELLARVQAGDIQAQAEFSAAVLGSNTTVNAGQLGAFQRPHYGANVNLAQDALLGGDIHAVNKFNAAVRGTSFEPTIIEGGVARPSGFALGDDGPGIVALPQTQATIAATNARAGAAVRSAAATAGAANARADLSRRTDPNRSKGKGKAKKPNPTGPAVSALWKDPSLYGQFSQHYGADVARAMMDRKP